MVPLPDPYRAGMAAVEEAYGLEPRDDAATAILADALTDDYAQAVFRPNRVDALFAPLRDAPADKTTYTTRGIDADTAESRICAALARVNGHAVDRTQNRTRLPMPTDATLDAAVDAAERYFCYRLEEELPPDDGRVARRNRIFAGRYDGFETDATGREAVLMHSMPSTAPEQLTRRR